jgi:hypothetical protein
VKLKTVLQQNREIVLRRWRELTLETYPANAVTFFAGQKDRFRNPVGHAISDGIGKIYDHIVVTPDEPKAREGVDQIVRVRSVQEFTPSQAVGFVFMLKTAIRDALNGQLPEVELTNVDARIDEVALMAFDAYAACREQLHDIRAREMMDRSRRLLDLVNRRSAGSKHEGVSTDEA